MLIDLGLSEVALLAAAVLVGATGTWSPCGFSMIETIGPTGHTGRRRVTIAACAAFLPGAVAGGVVTFGGLALVGSALPGGWLPYAVAAVLAALAAGAEARGARIAPQIRRQLPEHWRRVMPMPLAAGLYGILLGLGFTTFVLTFGVWALAGIALALGEPALGAGLGLGFGLGRALPVVTLAPIADRASGRAAVAAMAERPALYRGIRLGDAAALGVAALALLGTAVAGADVKRVKPGADPSFDRGDLVSQRGNRSGELRPSDGGVLPLPGTDPAIGGRHIAVIEGDDVVLLDRESLAEADRVSTPGADALALTGSTLAIRSRVKGRDRLQARTIKADGTIGEARAVAAYGPSSQIGRPSLDGTRLAYAVARRSANRIMVFRIGSGKSRAIKSSRRNALSNPSLFGRRMAYVRSTRRRHQLILRKLGSGRERVLRSGRARLWSTELTAKRVYVTVLRGRKPRARIVSERR